jgi:hypothetical protein
MRGYVENVFIVLTNSKSTLFALFLGFASFIGFLEIGDYVSNNFELSGLFAPMTASIRTWFGTICAILACATLAGFLKVAVKFFRKDWMRHFGD